MLEETKVENESGESEKTVKSTKADSEKVLKEAREIFARCVNDSNDNRNEALDDLKFARQGKQWPENILNERQKQGRPCLVINRLPSFIRQVVNDARQNKPQIKVYPVDSEADVETAKIINDLVRNIEAISRADIAYDTAIEYAVSMGFGYIRVCTDYSHTYSFEQDILIERVANPFVVYEDPDSESADGSDWKVCFVSEWLTKEEFKRQYPEAEETSFESDGKDELALWQNDNKIRVAEYWRRKTVKDVLLLLSNGEKILQSEYDKNEEKKAINELEGIVIQDQRDIERYEVKRYVLNGSEILKEDLWPGQYIPVVPVYGEEFFVEGKRILQSLIRPAKDSQRNYNYWRSATTEMVGLAPKAPWIGPKGFAKADAGWNTANTENHSYLEYDGPTPPQRQPFAAMPAGALQEALNSSSDLKDIMGIYDASLGAKSNETSGRAIMARQKEGDVSTFHFIDNLARSIRQVGAILIDLIPHIYSKPRIIRILGEDGTPSNVPINQPITVDEKGQPIKQEELENAKNAINRVYDLTIGKYDLVVAAGPSYNTKREEAAYQMTEFVRAYPAAAPVIGDLLAKNLDWPGAEEVAERLREVNPVLQKDKPQPPSAEAIKAQADAQAKQQEMQFKQQQYQADMAIKNIELQMKQMDLEIERVKAGAELAKVRINQPQDPNNII